MTRLLTRLAGYGAALFIAAVISWFAAVLILVLRAREALGAGR